MNLPRTRGQINEQIHYDLDLTSSVSFESLGKLTFLLNDLKGRDLPTLRQRYITTYRMGCCKYEHATNLWHCEMLGSDGSRQVLPLTKEGMWDAIITASEAMAAVAKAAAGLVMLAMFLGFS